MEKYLRLFKFLYSLLFVHADARNSPTYQTTVYWFKIQMTSAAECHIVEIPITQHPWPAFPHNTRPCPPPPPFMSTLTSPHPSVEATLHLHPMVSIVNLKFFTSKFCVFEVLCNLKFCVRRSLVRFKILYTSKPCTLQSLVYMYFKVGKVGDVIGWKISVDLNGKFSRC